MKIFPFKTRIVALAITLAVASPAGAAKRHTRHHHRPARPVTTSYVVKINGDTFREQNANLRRPPASLTKIMTALIVLERGRLDDVVTVSPGAARETGSRIGLRRGQRFRAGDLLAASLMASANDATRALADHVAGSQPAFVRLMYERAQRLGLHDTRFTNVCGHDDKGLYTTAHDLVILTDHALRNPTFAEVVARRSMSISTVQGNRSFVLRNKNRLIGRYPGALGVKTGTTPNAGQCLVAVAQRGDTRVVLVLMHARQRWSAAPALLDAAFEEACAEEIEDTGGRESNAASP
jgi:serine-type D-Ala-D-Ala carboxypeptidase (penicillin-binding protein 5/6)